MQNILDLQHAFPSAFLGLFLSLFSDTLSPLAYFVCGLVFTHKHTGGCLKCLFRLTRGVPGLVVWSEARWARIPEVQVRIPPREMGTFSPHAVSSIFVFL